MVFFAVKKQWHERQWREREMNCDLNRYAIKKEHGHKTINVIYSDENSKEKEKSKL